MKVSDLLRLAPWLNYRKADHWIRSGYVPGLDATPAS